MIRRHPLGEDETSGQQQPCSDLDTSTAESVADPHC
jgi:hypothetical protein